MHKAFITFVGPLLEYSFQVWFPITITAMCKLESVKTVYSMHTTSKSLLYWPSCHAKSWLCEVKASQIGSNILQHNFQSHCHRPSLWLQHHQTTSLHTRSSLTHNTFAKPFCCSIHLEQNLFTRIMDIWNSLPHNIISSISLDRLKKPCNIVTLNYF